jgi:hypothetical protein
MAKNDRKAHAHARAAIGARQSAGYCAARRSLELGIELPVLLPLLAQYAIDSKKSNKLRLAGTNCFLGFSFFAFFLALFALVIRKTGTWPIDHLFLYCLKRVRAPRLSFLLARKY